VERQRLEISIAEPSCDLERPPQVLLCLPEFASRVRGYASQPCELSVLDTLGLILQQMLRSLHPAGRDRTGREEVVTTSEP
jgi:hypothetical protein